MVDCVVLLSFRELIMVVLARYGARGVKLGWWNVVWLVFVSIFLVKGVSGRLSDGQKVARKVSEGVKA